MVSFCFPFDVCLFRCGLTEGVSYRHFCEIQKNFLYHFVRAFQSSKMSGMKCFASDKTNIPDGNSDIDCSSDSDFKNIEDSCSENR